MKKDFSIRISNVNLILTLLIVLTHCECFAYMSSDMKYYDIASVIGNSILVLCKIAVPTFFGISAFLFFFNYDNSKYFSKLKSRFRSLVIPYLIYSIFFFALFIIVSNVPYFKSFEGIYVPVEYNPLFFIKAILLGTYDGVLWYVQDLLILILLSPIFYLVAKRSHIINYLVITILIFITVYFQIGYYSAFYWTPIYLLFAHVAISYKEGIQDIDYSNMKVKLFKWLILLLYIGAFVLYVATYDNYYSGYVYRLISPFFVFMFIFNSKLINEKKEYSLCKYAFLIYCTHRFFSIAVKKILVLYLPLNICTSVLFTFLTFILIMAMLIVFIKVCEKICPRVLEVLTGGRINKKKTSN